MECSYRSNAEVVGYRERMYVIWKENGIFDVKERMVVGSEVTDCYKIVVLRFWVR